jgi:hypothetical protein
MSNKKIVGVRWFTGRDSIGLVVIDNGFEEKAYIGHVNGEDIDADIQFIIDYGTYFPIKQAKDLI